jgi:hypothetical protein
MKKGGHVIDNERLSSDFMWRSFSAVFVLVSAFNVWAGNCFSFGGYRMALWRILTAEWSKKL